MPMLGSNMSSTIFTALSAAGFAGSNLLNFTLAIGNGTVGALVGLPFPTTDVGTVPGVGAGSGVGLTGPVAPALSAAILSGLVAAFGQAGEDLPDVTDALADGLITELGLATLTSTHAPVFLGTGTIPPGAITASASLISGQIESEGVSRGFLGDSWPDLADVIGQEFANAMALATGSIVITGSPAGTPVPGAGTGSGTIS